MANPKKAVGRSGSRRPRTLGRPPESIGEETRRQILREARHCFGEFGYERTPLKMIAERAGITAGALYNYFRSKRDIFIAADRDSQDSVYRRIVEQIAEIDGLVEKMCRFLDFSLAVFEEDPPLANFIAASRIDALRHRELAPVLRDRRWEKLWAEMVEAGVQAGELSPKDAFAARGVVAATVMGLARLAVETNPSTHAEFIRGYKALLRGELLKPARRSSPVRGIKKPAK